MKIMKVLCVMLCMLSPFVEAEDDALDKLKSDVISFWGKAKEVASEVTTDLSDKTIEVSEKASDIGSKVAEDAKEKSSSAWDKLQEAGGVAAETAKEGASSLHELITADKCDENDVLCFNK